VQMKFEFLNSTRHTFGGVNPFKGMVVGPLEQQCRAKPVTPGAGGQLLREHSAQALFV
jgi:hypothetical protein